MDRVKFLVFKDTIKLLHNVLPYIAWPSSWRSLCTLLEKCTHHIKVTLMQWLKPPEIWVKLNTDGSVLSNPGKIWAGGILGDSNGRLNFAFSVPLGDGTNNQAEVEAATFGIAWCVHLKYTKVILEVNSQLLVDSFLHKTVAPWNISTHIQKLRNLSTFIPHFKCIHMLQEANYVADSLSKHIHQITNPQVYFSSNNSLEIQHHTYN